MNRTVQGGPPLALSFFCLLIVRVAWKGRENLSSLGGNWCLNRKAVEVFQWGFGPRYTVTVTSSWEDQEDSLCLQAC